MFVLLFSFFFFFSVFVFINAYPFCTNTILAFIRTQFHFYSLFAIPLRMPNFDVSQLFRLKSNKTVTTTTTERKKVSIYSPFQQPSPPNTSMLKYAIVHTHIRTPPPKTLIESQSTFLHLIFEFVFPLGEFFSFSFVFSLSLSNEPISKMSVGTFAAVTWTH